MKARFAALGALCALAVLAPPACAGMIWGRVLDAETGLGLAGARVGAVPPGRQVFTRADGTFRMAGLEAGPCSLAVGRLGYFAAGQRIVVPAQDSLECVVRLRPRPIPQEPVIAVAPSRDLGAPFTGQVPVRLENRELRGRLAGTVGETLAGLPGLTQRTMGAAPARPVLRGLSGNRLLLLQDGERMGDLSATSADHAVVIDPVTASAIAVIRGPAALLFGSNTQGGVIDVERNTVPRDSAPRTRGTTRWLAESARPGGAWSSRAEFPLPGSITAAVDLGLRRAGDTRTPSGLLRNTGIATQDISLGAARITPRDQLGGSVGRYTSEYGIPGGFLGGHPHGVNIAITRTHTEFRGVHRLDDAGRQELRGHVSWSRYGHDEIESGGVCGVSFGQLTTDAGVQWARTSPRTAGRLIAGLWGEARDYDTACLSFVPHTRETGAAGFVYGERNVGPAAVRGALRFDRRQVTPDGEKVTKAGHVRPREFSGVSAGAALTWPARGDVRGELTLMRTFNAPGIEELYSDGPHLAAYSYEVGNASLGPERGIGLEGSLSGSSPSAGWSVSLYDYRFTDFIFPSDTGQLEYGPGETGVLERYQYLGRDARISGGDASAWWRSGTPRGWRLGTSAGITRGELRDAGQPLPAMPPLAAQVSLARTHDGGDVEVVLRAAARQGRTGEFEAPTAGYAVVDLRLAHAIPAGDLLHTLSVTVENVGNRRYWNHLSRVRSVMPEAGRNVRVLWQIEF